MVHVADIVADTIKCSADLSAGHLMSILAPLLNNNAMYATLVYRNTTKGGNRLTNYLRLLVLRLLLAPISSQSSRHVFIRVFLTLDWQGSHNINTKSYQMFTRCESRRLRSAMFFRKKGKV